MLHYVFVLFHWLASKGIEMDYKHKRIKDGFVYESYYESDNIAT